MAKTDLEALRQELKAHVESEILLRKEPLRGDEDLIDAGFDSMSLTRTLVFVEDRFGVSIPDKDVVLDELSTIDKLARFVHARLA